MGLGTAKRIYVGRELEKSSHNKEREGLVSGTPSLLFSSLLLKVFCFFMPTTVPQSLVGAEHWLHSLWRFPMLPQLTPYSLIHAYPPKYNVHVVIFRVLALNSMHTINLPLSPFVPILWFYARKYCACVLSMIDIRERRQIYTRIYYNIVWVGW